MNSSWMGHEEGEPDAGKRSCGMFLKGIGIPGSHSLLPGCHEVSGFVLYYSSSQKPVLPHHRSEQWTQQPRTGTSESQILLPSVFISFFITGKKSWHRTQSRPRFHITWHLALSATLCCCGKTALTRADVRNTLVSLMVPEQEFVTVGEDWQQVARAGSWWILSSTANTRQRKWPASGVRVLSQSLPPHVGCFPKGSITSLTSTTNSGTKCSNAWASGGHFLFEPPHSLLEARNISLKWSFTVPAIKKNVVSDAGGHDATEVREGTAWAGTPNILHLVVSKSHVYIFSTIQFKRVSLSRTSVRTF